MTFQIRIPAGSDADKLLPPVLKKLKKTREDVVRVLVGGKWKHYFLEGTHDDIELTNEEQAGGDDEEAGASDEADTKDTTEEKPKVTIEKDDQPEWGWTTEEMETWAKLNEVSLGNATARKTIYKKVKAAFEAKGSGSDDGKTDE